MLAGALGVTMTTAVLNAYERADPARISHSRLVAFWNYLRGSTYKRVKSNECDACKATLE